MAGNSWSVDAAGVSGVLALIDDHGNQLEQVSRDIRALEARSSELSANGRNDVSQAFNTFCDDRRDVPNHIMWLIQQRCNQVIEASVAVIAGDAEMATGIKDAKAYASATWGIEE